MTRYFFPCVAALALQYANLQGVDAIQYKAKHGKSFFFGETQKKSFVKPLDMKHRLRVCNAYPYPTGIEVFRGKTEKLTEDSPLQYKDCRDFRLRLKAGDKLDFKFGDATAGTFSVSELPGNSAVLFLAVSRHDNLSTAVSFSSHVFANLLNAQIAVLDTYKGTKAAKLQIEDTAGSGSRRENLRYDSVVAVNPGHYQTVLTDTDGKVAAKQDLVTVNRESYVVLRVGVDAKEGKSYPEELLVFPQTDSVLLRSDAPFGYSSMLTVLMTVGASVMLM